jgi:hypothetical protein
MGSAVSAGKEFLRTTLILTVASVLGACAPVLLAPSAALAAGTVTLNGCLGSNTSAWKTTSNGGTFGLEANCPAVNLNNYPTGFSLGGGHAANGQYASWFTSVPPGMQITNGNVVAYYARNLTAGGWAGEWKYGTQGAPLANTTATVGGVQGMNFSVYPLGPPVTLFGWSIQCRAAAGCSNNGDLIQVGDVTITAQENLGPTITPSGLWNASGYVWGTWSVAATANGPSGVCSLSVSLGGKALAGAVTKAPDQSVWDQCGVASIGQLVDLDTGGYGQGAVPLVFTDSDAAQLGAPMGKTVNIDSTRPGISLSGPTDALSTAGTQYITATATAGLSRVKGISCSLDGAPASWYAGAGAQIPVSGIGVHHLQCVSKNNSYDSNGQPNSSAVASWTLSIREPAVTTVSFSRIKGLQCGKVREREKIPAHWVKVRRHGKPVRVKRRARTVVRRVEQCHVRVVMKRICHAGHCHRQRVVKLPHVVQLRSRRVRYGKGTTVSGWVGTTAGVALGGQKMQIFSAPDNGSNAFTQTAVVTTEATGVWSAKLPAGPSRLVEAVYGGASTVEPAASPLIRLLVPAKVKISIHPRRVPWGGTIRITGRVLGGYIPRGKLLRLRIGVAGIRETVGIPNVQRNGRFQTTWKFASGSGVVRYWFSISTLSEADYPFAAASSRRVYVTVGP